MRPLPAPTVVLAGLLLALGATSGWAAPQAAHYAAASPQSTLSLTITVDSCTPTGGSCTGAVGYSDTQVAELVADGDFPLPASSRVMIDAEFGTFRFESDGTQQLDPLPAPALTSYFSFAGGALEWIPIPGLDVIPATGDTAAFSITGPDLVVTGGIDLSASVSNPFSGSLDLATLSTVAGDLQASVSTLLVGPEPVPVSGSFETFGDGVSFRITLSASGLESLLFTDVAGLADVDFRLGASLEVELDGTLTFECNDGEDNDGDALVDFGADPGCSSPVDDAETDPPGAPSLGPLALALLSLGLAGLGARLAASG